MTVQQRLRPVGVRLRQRIVLERLSAEERLPDSLQLRRQTRRQNGKSHDLNQADVFLFDVVQAWVGVIESERSVLGGEVVSEHQIALKRAVAHPRNRRDGVVRRAVGEGKHRRRFVGVGAPML